jgi:enterochelin esterase-like enzyme
VGLTGAPLLVLTALLALGLPVASLWLWQRLPGPRPVRVGGRLSLVVMAQAFAVLLALVSVNDQYLFFVSWQDLLGAPPTPGAITALSGPQLTGRSGTAPGTVGSVSNQADGGQLVRVTLRGTQSHVTGRVLIHLPAGYSATSTRRYPVIELLQGWHAPPESWINNLHVFDVMAMAQRTGALGPVITVMPDINVASPRDAECTNIPQGPQVATFLTTDVRNLLLSRYRALPYRTSWGLMGFSTGGYCAAKFALQHPEWFGATVVMSGYFDAIKDRTTRDLWGGSPSYRNENSVLWLLTHRPRPTIDMLAFASRYDKDSYPSTAQFLALPHAPMQVYSLISPHGGHNFKPLRAALPEMLAWLGARLSYLSPVLPVQPVASQIPARRTATPTTASPTSSAPSRSASHRPRRPWAVLRPTARPNGPPNPHRTPPPNVG